MTDIQISGSIQAKWIMETESKTTRNEADLEAKGEKNTALDNINL